MTSANCFFASSYLFCQRYVFPNIAKAAPLVTRPFSSAGRVSGSAAAAALKSSSHCFKISSWEE